MKAALSAVLVCALGLATACASADDQRRTEVKVVASVLHCGSGAGLQLITQAQDWPATLATVLPNLDWSRQQILLVRMGTQANPGYALQYSEGATLQAKTLDIPLAWQQPDPQRMYPQMIVEPCLALSIPRQGYSNIVVRDQSGTIKFRLALSE